MHFVCNKNNPIEMGYDDKNGAPSRIRTYGLRLRSPLLYPAELSGHGFIIAGFLAGVV